MSVSGNWKILRKIRSYVEEIIANGQQTDLNIRPAIDLQKNYVPSSGVDKRW
eukprot:TRINITY_DN457_c1_g1_i1.p2 TRINITY_DN457_c1_g1~~TRINITY_DN457_c1_g1_i1.p2  ORF type:complete len:52 (+),score=3.98 TRINITY_DN457_c1_g1_i1:210-365(+)